MKQREIAKVIGFFTNSTLQRYRYDEDMQSPYKSKKPKTPQKASNYLESTQMTSKGPMISDITNRAHYIKTFTNQKNKFKDGSTHEINDENLD